MLYYSHNKEQNKKPTGTSKEPDRHQSKNIKKGSSIITGAKEKSNESTEKLDHTRGKEFYRL